MGASLSQRRVLEQLTEQIRQCEGMDRAHQRESVPSGIPGLDQLIPEGGLRRGALLEWVAAVPGSGALRLALVAARAACGPQRLCMVVDRRREFYPLAASSVALGVEQMVVVQPANAADEAWAIDQSLRCGGVGAVLCWPARLDDHTFRRWQLAAEASGAVGLIIRTPAARSDPSWADVKLLVTPLTTTVATQQRRWSIEILHARGTLRRGARCEVSTAELVVPPSRHAAPHYRQARVLK